MNPVARDFISKLLTKDPKARLGHGSRGASEVRKHPFFADLDWQVRFRGGWGAVALLLYTEELKVAEIKRIKVATSEGATGWLNVTRRSEKW